jgi:hypothetical protein
MVELHITDIYFDDYPALKKLISATERYVLFEDLSEDADTEYVAVVVPIGSGFYFLRGFGFSKEEAILEAIKQGFSMSEICEFFKISEKEYDEYLIKCLKETDPEEWEFGDLIFEYPHISTLLSSDQAVGIFKIDDETYIIAWWKIYLSGPYNFSFKRVDFEEAKEFAERLFNEETIEKFFEEKE